VAVAISGSMAKGWRQEHKFFSFAGKPAKEEEQNQLA
jgi:hypothetical protein